MLLRFTASNHLSIFEPTELSMLASTGLKDDESGLLEVPGLRGSALPSVMIYGPNAAGKTTILSALRAFRSHIVNSATNRGPSQKIPFNPFKLNKDGPVGSSVFSADFIYNNVRHHYGFEFNATSFLREWLFSYPEGQPRQLFTRDNGEFSFGKNLKGHNRVVEKLTRQNALFLSTAAQNAHPYLSGLFKSFEDSYRFVDCDVQAARLSYDVGDDGLDPRVVEFLRLADTGVQDARLSIKPLDEEMKKRSQQLIQALREALPSSASVETPDADQYRDLRLGHLGKDMEDFVYLPLSSESRGTVRLLALLLNAFEVIDEGGVLLVDELDASLHTVLAREFIGLFQSKKWNPKGAQLIATLHDTNILEDRSMRRDQFWFAQKDAWGQTALVPMTDTHTRAGENYERLYLNGRFGALPSSPTSLWSLAELGDEVVEP